MNYLHLFHFLLSNELEIELLFQKRVTKSIFAQKYTPYYDTNLCSNLFLCATAPSSAHYLPPFTVPYHFTHIFLSFNAIQFHIHFAIHVDRQNRQNRRETGPHVLLARVQIQKKGGRDIKHECRGLRGIGGGGS